MGIIFNIQKFSVNDGPGIRTTVFLKGCPLNCVWCHNPESKRMQADIFYQQKKCVGCGRCEMICEKNCHAVKDGKHVYNRKECDACGRCTEACVTKALESVGHEASVDEVIKEVLKDKAFYDNSGGGLTISGGEPTLQFSFTYDLLKAAKENGLHTCIETCGYAKEEYFKQIADFVDIFLFDYKESDSKRHKEFTGVTNDLILKNLKMLDEMGCKIVLRCPIIPGVNDRDDHFEGITKVANSMKNVMEINIEPYHPLGRGKADMLGEKYGLENLTFPDEGEIKEWIRKISEKTHLRVKKA